MASTRPLARALGAFALAALLIAPAIAKAQDSDALIARVKAHVDREVPPEAIRHEGLELQLFGFVPVGVDYEAETFKLLQAQLAGFYEETDGTMYMAGDLDEMTADATLSHELVHALQDQRWNLGSLSRYRPGEDDRTSALAALAEGDATSAMADALATLDGKSRIMANRRVSNREAAPAPGSPSGRTEVGRDQD